MAAHNSNKKIEYVYNLPFFEREEVCKILDQNEKWEELASIWMKFDDLTIKNLKEERRPTEKLLNLWGEHNHTVLELFLLLLKMKQYDSMVPLKQFVDTKYHILLEHGRRTERKSASQRRDQGIGTQNFNKIEPTPKEVPKVLLQESIHNRVAKILNRSPQPNTDLVSSNSDNMLVRTETNKNLPLVLRPVANGSKNNGQSTSVADTALPETLYEELAKATNYWSSDTILGKGGFGTVFRGKYETWDKCDLRRNQRKLDTFTENCFGYILRFYDLFHKKYSNQESLSEIFKIHRNLYSKISKSTGTWKNTQVAIKRIEQRGPDSNESYLIQLEQSLRELKILNAYRHDNILSLYAYSMGGEAPCLVYQYMSNGSLEDRLLLRQRTKPLNWLQRHEIAKGTARGLQFLHTIGNKPLIHGDIKSANILLDKNYEPKIGDFGLAREGPEQDYMKVSRVQGTRPYLPDEFLLGRNLSTKIDTYSYGIVLLELATGLGAYSNARAQHKFLKDFVDSYETRDLHSLKDQKAGIENQQVYQNLIILGKWCSNRLSKDRPEMVSVLRKLDDLSETRNDPLHP